MKEYIAVEKQTDSGGFIDIVSELILCKDCEFNPSISLVGCPMAGLPVRPDGYCYKARRKEE